MNLKSFGCFAILSVVLVPLAAVTLAGCGSSGGSNITSLLVTKAAGGTVTNGAASVTIPANSLAADTTITAQPASGLPAAPSGMAVISGTGATFGPDGTTFSPSATLVLGYNPTSVPSSVSVSSLRICQVVGTGWQDLGGTVDSTAHTVTTPIAHFTTYAILGVVTAGTLNPTDFAGNWSGVWRNNTFNSQNNTTMTVAVNGTAKTATITLQIFGNVLGTFTNPPAETYSGTYDSTHFTINANSTIFGSATLTIDASGNLTGHANTTQNTTVSSVDLTGTVNSQSISANYTVHFRDNSTATGTLTFTKS